MSLFFGNSEQTIATTRASVTRTGSATEVDGEFQFNYGEATGPDGVAFVAKRSWLTRVTGQYRPFNPVSPFAVASIESSFEKRIDVRYNAGLGARVNAISTPRTTLNWSVALLGEKTEFDEEVGPGAEEELARWSTSLKVRRTLADEGVVFNSETSYRPEFDAFDRFTLSSTSSLSYALSDDLSMKVSFIDNYDSEAEARGARSNNDGQITFGLLSSF